MKPHWECNHEMTQMSVSYSKNGLSGLSPSTRNSHSRSSSCANHKQTGMDLALRSILVLCILWHCICHQILQPSNRLQECRTVKPWALEPWVCCQGEAGKTCRTWTWGESSTLVTHTVTPQRTGSTLSQTRCLSSHQVKPNSVTAHIQVSTKSYMRRNRSGEYIETEMEVD